MRFLGRTVETASDIDEWRRALRDQRARQILASGKQELRRSDLDFGRYWIEHTPTGDFFVPWTGDPSYAPNDAPAFYVTKEAEPVILVRADPASRDELEQKRAARAARRAAREAAVKARNEERRRALR